MLYVGLGETSLTKRGHKGTMTVYAQNFYEIPRALQANEVLRGRMLKLIKSDPIPGKVLEGGTRCAAFRDILADYTNGIIGLDESAYQVEDRLPRSTSIYSANNRVFSRRWSERLVRTQVSRFYNQAVLLELQSQGQSHCFVPHSAYEDSDSPCLMGLAGCEHRVDHMLAGLERRYRDGNWVREESTVPNHPNCTHVVSPVERR